MVEYDKDAIVYPYITEYLRKEIPEKKGILKDILFIGTGALLSPMAVMQGQNIPGIAHLVHLKMN